MHTDTFFDALIEQSNRRQFTHHGLDPTVVTIYQFPRDVRKRSVLKLTESWGVEAYLTILGHTWWSYDNRFFVWLFGGLEDAYLRRRERTEEDPMGPASRYE